MAAGKEGSGGSATNSAVIDRIRQYYEENHELYLNHVGHTFQIALLPGLHDDLCRSTSLHAVKACGLSRGSRILDAGCGVCGPAVHICQAVEDARVVGITVSDVQAATGRELVAEAGLADRIQIVIGDYHFLPYEDGSFDAAVFLETACYSYDLPQLFSEVYRVVRPGGKIYVKDVFHSAGALTALQRAELQAFDAIYKHTTRPVDVVVRAIENAGFGRAQSRTATEVSMAHFIAASFEPGEEGSKLSAFGRRHFRRWRSPSLILFAEIVGTKLREESVP